MKRFFLTNAVSASILMLLAVCLISCESDVEQLRTYQFSCFSCSGGQSDFSELEKSFPFGETFKLFDTKSNADEYMINKFRILVSNIDENKSSKSIVSDDFFRVYLREIGVDGKYQIRDVTSKEWRNN